MDDKMFYTRDDLVSFGYYLLSGERKRKIDTEPERHGEDTYEEMLKVRLQDVYHSDVENWKEKRGFKKQLAIVKDLVCYVFLSGVLLIILSAYTSGFLILPASLCFFYGGWLLRAFGFLDNIFKKS